MVIASNYPLFSNIAQKLDPGSPQGFGFIVTLSSLMTAILTILFLGVGIRRLLKPALVSVIIISAILGYFTQELGVVFSPEMIANIDATIADRNLAEASELVSFALVRHVILFAALPSLLVVMAPVAARTPAREILTRLACAIGCVLVVLISGLVNYRYVTYFAVENRDLRLQATPFYAFASLHKYLDSMHADDPPELLVLGRDAVQQKSGRRRIVGVLVVGETARSDHFSLNGYLKDTNPMLETDGVVSFRNVAACGTSTAYSVPCMFFLRGRENYTPARAWSESNVLDVLGYAGVEVTWIENNSTCRDVCRRVETIDLRAHPDDRSPWYSDHGYYDEAMVSELRRVIERTNTDQLIVLHTMGSHGPTYSRRYPDTFATFTPYCSRKSPVDCTSIEVNNAYDNTILYTDYLLDEIIGLLQSRATQLDSFLLYASDHGESLGEDGIYLHGLPYDIAPAAQKKVPVIAWLSDDYAGRHNVQRPDPDAGKTHELSHDYLPHSLLGLFEVRTGVYRRDYDLFRPSG